MDPAQGPSSPPTCDNDSIKLSKKDFTNAAGFLKFKKFVLLRNGENDGHLTDKLEYDCALGDECYISYYRVICNRKYYVVKIVVSEVKHDGSLSDAVVLSKNELGNAENFRFTGIKETAGVARILAYGELDTSNLVAGEHISVGTVLVMDYCCYGQLQTLITDLVRAEIFLPEPLVWRALIDLVTVIYNLTKPLKDHDGKEVPIVIHRGINPGNIMVTRYNEKMPIAFKLCDFEQAHCYDTEALDVHLDEARNTHTGTQSTNAQKWQEQDTKVELSYLVQAIYFATTIGACACPCALNIPGANLSNNPFLNWNMYPQEYCKASFSDHRPIIIKLAPQYSEDLQHFFESALGVVGGGADQWPTPEEALKTLKEVGSKYLNNPWVLPAGILEPEVMNSPTGTRSEQQAHLSEEEGDSWYES